MHDVVYSCRCIHVVFMLMYSWCCIHGIVYRFVYECGCINVVVNGVVVVLICCTNVVIMLVCWSCVGVLYAWCIHVVSMVQYSCLCFHAVAFLCYLCCICVVGFRWLYSCCRVDVAVLLWVYHCWCTTIVWSMLHLVPLFEICLMNVVVTLLYDVCIHAVLLLLY